jgi:LysM repeat protein
MKKFRLKVILTIFLLLSVGLAACVRSAYNPAPTDEQGDFPVPEATQSAIEALGAISTQTAEALEGGGDGDAAEGDEAATEGEGDEAAPEDSGDSPTEAPKPTATPEPTEEEPEPTEEPETEPEEYEVPEKYTLENGEFPYCIARRFDIDPDALLNANGLNRNSVVYPGTELKIPQDAGSFDEGSRALRKHPTTYTVQAGDTVNTIACRYGDVDPRAILAKNGLSEDDKLTVGDTLEIP